MVKSASVSGVTHVNCFMKRRLIGIFLRAGARLAVRLIAQQQIKSHAAAPQVNTHTHTQREVMSCVFVRGCRPVMIEALHTHTHMHMLQTVQVCGSIKVTACVRVPVSGLVLLMLK